MSTYSELAHANLELELGGHEWVIFMTEGREKFVVTEGPSWSMDFGEQIFETLAGVRNIVKGKNKWKVYSR